MFRGSPNSFILDSVSLAAAKNAIHKNSDLKTNQPFRQFFYIRFMHSESVTDQERCVRLFLSRIPETGQENLFCSRAHRDVIRKCGRFPFRNNALSRSSTGHK
jgi:uncharacterized protein (DUF924 family)